MEQIHLQTHSRMSLSSHAVPTRKRCRSRDDDSDDSDDLSSSSSHHHAKKTRSTLTAFSFTTTCARDFSPNITPSTTAPSTPASDTTSMDIDPSPNASDPETEWESENSQRLQENRYQLQSIQQQVQMHQLREIQLQVQAASSAPPPSSQEGEGGKRCTIIAGFNRGFGRETQVPTVQTSWGGGQGEGGGAFPNSNSGGYL